MKTEPIVSSETSAIRTQTPGNYPKRNKLHITTLLTHLVKQDVHITLYQCSKISKKLLKQTRLEVVGSTVPLIKIPVAFFAA